MFAKRFRVEPVVATSPAIYLIVPVAYLNKPLKVVCVESISILLVICPVVNPGHDTVPVPTSTILEVPLIV
jgi:hypothetical protein